MISINFLNYGKVFGTQSLTSVFLSNPYVLGFIVGTLLIAFYVVVLPATILFVRRVMKKRDLNNELGVKP